MSAGGSAIFGRLGDGVMLRELVFTLRPFVAGVSLPSFVVVSLLSQPDMSIVNRLCQLESIRTTAMDAACWAEIRRVTAKATTVNCD